MTGAFPVMSLEGKQYYFVAYDYDTSAIFAIPITDLRYETIIKAFIEVFEELVDPKVAVANRCLLRTNH